MDRCRNFFSVLLIFAFAFSVILPLTAAESKGKKANQQRALKIAVVNMDTLFSGYHKTSIEEAKLQKQAEIYQEYARELAESLKKLRAEFVTLRDASQNMALSAAERENRRLNAADKYNQFMAKERELKEYTRTKQAQLREEQDKMRHGILLDIKKVIAARCQLEGIDLVLDQGARMPGDIPSVVYASGALNITADILKVLNTGLKGASSAKKVKMN